MSFCAFVSYFRNRFCFHNEAKMSIIKFFSFLKTLSNSKHVSLFHLFICYLFLPIYLSNRSHEFDGKFIKMKKLIQGKKQKQQWKISIHKSHINVREKKKKKMETSTINSFFKLTVSIWKDGSKTSALYTMLIISFLWIRLCDVSYSHFV